MTWMDNHELTRKMKRLAKADWRETFYTHEPVDLAYRNRHPEYTTDERLTDAEKKLYKEVWAEVERRAMTADLHPGEPIMTPTQHRLWYGE